MKGENGELLDMINAGLANLKASGEYDAIIGTYISGLNIHSERNIWRPAGHG